MARASTYTLLALDRFSEIIGIPPAHFNQAAGATYFPDNTACSNIFYQYAWQNFNHVGREDVARAIKRAEDDITGILGYSPAPIWVEDEIQRYPAHYRKDVYEYGMNNSRGMGKSVKLNYGKFIQAGRRAASLVAGAAPVVYSDVDNDGYDETATITRPTTVTDECELKVYFAGHSGQPEWEIRPARTVTLSGGNVTFTFWAWQLIDPDLLGTIPTTTAAGPVDLEAAGSYVTTVDIYRVYTDFSQASAAFYWTPAPGLSSGVVGLCCSACGGTGCIACELTTQDGCIHVRDIDMGLVVPSPGTYDATTGDWTQAAPSVCRDPDMVKVWYYAGDQGQEYLKGRTCDPLSDYWAQAITWLAVARIHQPFCTCNNSLTLVQEWQRDLRFTGSRHLGQFVVSIDELDNPLGTRMGEVMAWKRVARFSNKQVVGGIV